MEKEKENGNKTPKPELVSNNAAYLKHVLAGSRAHERVFIDELSLYLLGGLVCKWKGLASYLAMGEQDLLQEALSAVWPSLKDYDETKGSTLFSFVFTLARQHFIDKIGRKVGAERRKGLLTSMPLDAPWALDKDGSALTVYDTAKDELAEDPRLLCQYNEIMEHLGEAFSAQKAEFYRLARIEGRTYDEIAAKFGIDSRHVGDCVREIKAYVLDKFSPECLRLIIN